MGETPVSPPPASPNPGPPEDRKTGRPEDRKSEEREPSAPPQEPRQARSRQDTSIPTLEGELVATSTAIVAVAPQPETIGAIRVGTAMLKPRGLGGGSGLGGFEDRASWFEDTEHLLETHGEAFKRDYGPLDGKGNPKRPTIASIITNKWGAFVAKRAREGQAAAIELVRECLAERAEKYRRAWEHDAPAQAASDDPVERRAKADWWARHQRGEDVGAFDSWFAKNRGNFEKPASTSTSAHPADSVSPEEVSQLLANARPTAQPVHGRAVAPKRDLSTASKLVNARAGPGGGERGSGATEATS